MQHMFLDCLNCNEAHMRAYMRIDEHTMNGAIEDHN